MIKTFRIQVGGEKTAFYIETKYKEKVVDALKNFDVLSPVNQKYRIAKPDRPDTVKRKLTKKEGGCIRCGEPRGNCSSKQYCRRCRRELREIRH